MALLPTSLHERDGHGYQPCVSFRYTSIHLLPSLYISTDSGSFLAYRENSDSTLKAYKEASANAKPAKPANEDPPVVGGTLSSKDDAEASSTGTASGSGSNPTETGGAVGSVRLEWIGVAAGVVAWLI